jgi:hypothetical protein
LAAQLVLGLGLAAANYQHWDGYRQFAASLRKYSGGHRVWVDDPWGLRFYLESDGALPSRKGQRARPGDLLVASELGSSVDFTVPVNRIAQADVRPSVPLRLIGIDSHSGWSSVARGYWPFGISGGPVDRVKAEMVAERRPTLEYLPMDAPEAKAQIVSGIYAQEGKSRWMAGDALVALKTPATPRPLSVSFYLPPQARARSITLLLDGREVAAHTYAGPGAYTLTSAPAIGSSLEIRVDRTFSAPGDNRELGVVLQGAGFTP